VAALTRHLLTLRHRYIVPLLHPGGAVEGKVLKTAPGMVAVSWRFPSGTLSLALNIGTKPVDLPALAGRRALPGRKSTTFYRRTVLSFALLMEKHRYDPFRHVPYSVP
jgi:hypothetical protein